MGLLRGKAKRNGVNKVCVIDTSCFLPGPFLLYYLGSLPKLAGFISAKSTSLMNVLPPTTLAVCDGFELAGSSSPSESLLSGTFLGIISSRSSSSSSSPSSAFEVAVDCFVELVVVFFVGVGAAFFGWEIFGG